MTNAFHYGVCYFPEHWPADWVPDDLSRIRDAGFTYVRIGEGAWAYFEPQEGHFRFELFDSVVKAADERGLKIIFGTPTYCGPAWIGTTYPEVYRWDFNRTPMKHGGRRNYTYTSPRYLELSDRIVTALATHYRRAKPIIAWQIDNEFNCHMDVSYAPTDTLAFRAWLRQKYKTLDALNAAWGTRFWSQTYDAWDQIDLPHPTVAYNNPTQKLDESRFISDTVIAYSQRQAAILRGINPKWRLTHNGLFGNIDGPKLAATVDFWSHDQYPQFYDGWTSYAANLIQSRSLGFPFAIMEQQAGPGGQMNYLHATPRAGQMRLWSYQSIAHGANMLGYFCWRTCPFGSEQHWHGLLDPDNKRTRRLDEATQLGNEIAAFPKDALEAPLERAVALLRDYDNEINESRINTYVKPKWEAGNWQAALLRNHVPVDQTWPDKDWNGYRLLIAPHLRLCDPPLVKKYDAFVRAGGTLVLGAQSGTKDRNLHLVQATPPGALRKLTGVEVEDWSNVTDDRTFACQADTFDLQLGGFVERLKLRGATALAMWNTDDTLLAGAPAITLNRVGAGQVIYIGGYVDYANAATLLPHLLQLADIESLGEFPPEVEVIARRSSRGSYLWLLNHSHEPQFLNHLPAGTDLITARPVDGSLKLPPYGVAVIQPRSRA
ncbi:MAG: beta-galactosidase [Tepidisphaeraceae bacterium]